MMGSMGIPMVGKTFGNLRVLREMPSSPRAKKFEVECLVCGQVRTRLGGNIRRAEALAAFGCACGHKGKTHGQSSRPGYKTWEGMIARCYRPSHPAFKDYGGRGIAVCDEWRDDPAAFLDWLDGQLWRRGLQVDRRDNDQGYSPQNCRVVQQTVNMNNTRSNRRIFVAGIEMTVTEASRRFGIGKTTIKERLNRGWSHEDAVRPIA